MLGARATGELSCSGSSTGCALRVTSRAARWPIAVEDRPAALNSSSCDAGIGLNRSLHHWWRLVKRTRSGLRHHHSPGGQRGCGRRGVRMSLPTMSGRGLRRGCRGFNNNFSSRLRFGRNSDRFDNWQNGDHNRFDCFSNRSSHNRRCVNFSLCCGSWRFRCCWRGRCWRNRMLDDHGHSRRRDGDGRALHDRGTCRSLGNHRLGWRARSNGRRNRRTHDNGRRRTGLRNNLARFRLGWRRGRDGDNRRRWARWCLGGLRYRPSRQMTLPGLFFLFLFLGEDGLHHVAGLGNMR